MKTILLVEDDFHIQEIYRTTFIKTGNYTVETASDGQEALVKLGSHIYDLILLDIMLPKVTGIDVLRAMRAPTSPTKDTPIILITNLGQEDIIKEAFKIGADGYLIKAQFTPLDIVREVDAFFQQMKEMQNQPAVPSAETAVPAPASIPVAAATPSVPVVQPPYQQPVSQSSSSQPATTPAAENPQ